jgi:hypothetical protein
MPKLIAPSQDEFDSWQLHPVSQYILEAYRIAAEKQRQAWDQYFEANLIPADLAAKRLELRTREDAYRSILENTLVDYIAIVDPETLSGSRSQQPRRASR